MLLEKGLAVLQREGDLVGWECFIKRRFDKNEMEKK